MDDPTPHSGPLRILVVGAGAIGGFIAARLALAGHQVAVVARGRQLEAIASEGLRLVTSSGADEVASVQALATPDEAGRSDAVLVTVKAHQLEALAPSLARAAARSRMLVPIQNGIGWWYFQGTAGPHAGRRIDAVDPRGLLLETLPTELIVPMLAFKAAEVIAPGVIRHIPSGTDQFPLGELDGSRTSRVRNLAGAMATAGLGAPVTDIRETMWAKLLGNVYANPICALTQLPLGPVVSHPETRELAMSLMKECAGVAASLGVVIPMSFEERLDRSAAVGDARPSMLQDRSAGRPMELDAILGALVELGRLRGVPTPCVRALLSCLRLIESRNSQ